MAGVSGARVKAAFARSNTWGVPASVTRGVHLRSTEGLDGGPTLVNDESFNQTFIGDGEAGDYAPLTPELACQLRYDDSIPIWLAAAMGSTGGSPTVISSQAANSLVAYQHVLDLAPELTHFFTLAVDTTQYVLEVPSLKMRGFTIRVGDGGAMQVSFPAIGTKPVYNSTVNVNSTVGGAAAATLTTRVFRRHGVIRMNIQSAGSLAAIDANSLVREMTFGPLRTLAQDHVFGTDYIAEADEDGWPDFPIEVTYARMNTVSANSLAIGLAAARSFKSDFTFTSNVQINSSAANTAYSMLFQFPNLQLTSFRAPVVGHGLVRPVATFQAKLAATSPTGMAFVNPMRVTIVNMNSANLLA